MKISGMHNLHILREAENEIRHCIRKSNKTYINNKILKRLTPQVIRVGRAAGLPFDSLVNDVVSGCLPHSTACYGMCFAALSAWKQGYDFGKRVNNILDKRVLEKDINDLPPAQKYIRCGWNSDPSWNWAISAEIATIARRKGLLTIFITKAFTSIDNDSTGKLIAAKAEMRVSVSALDSNKDLEKRLNFIKKYRNDGGVCIPIVLTLPFKSTELQARQINIVNWMVKNDFPAAENSLRFPVDSLMTDFADKNLMRPHDDGQDIWSGRIFPDKLLFPTTTTLPDSYSGIESAFLSGLDIDGLKTTFADPVSTHEEVIQSDKSLSKPKMCGVSINYR